MDTKPIFIEKISNKLKPFETKSSFKYIYQPKFVFLCGKASSTIVDRINSRRGVLSKYFSERNNKIYCVWSEDLWRTEFSEDIDLLTFEEFLAELCNCIVIFVESMGSACELGAFTFEEKLFMSKLVIVLDTKYKKDSSFINQGPVAKARANNAQVVYIDFKNAIMAEREFVSRIDAVIHSFEKRSIENKIEKNINEKQVRIASFIIEILEIIKIVGPVSQEIIIGIYKQYKKFTSFSFVKKDGTAFRANISVGYIFRILEKVNLIKKDEQEKYILVNSDFDVNFMFGMGGYSNNLIRSKILALKYKYRG